ncbi:uncharacterized protein K02A2.6-like [Uranotaenia lowii]|uniref:uncharacterized protein K02A2.6-like n=1 Tax=Uranotaenia lowii TaxID=190385 RepID=UPI00247A3CE0|nr:uncharacterized protein K02A2.6-like [Uranotaenia lowii]
MNVKPPEFNIGDSWSLYEERLRRFFVAYGVEEEADERRSAFLLTAVSMEVYQTIRNLCFPDKPETKQFDELCSLMRQRFTPTLVTFHERTRFIEARQGDGETVIEWSTRLKKLAADCEFGNDLPVFLKNIFVVGLKRGPVYERVCEEDPDSNLEALVKVAMKKESTLRQRESLEVNKFQSDQGNKLKKPASPNFRCYACGKGDHNFRKCQYKSYVYKVCDKKGHLAKVCPNRKDATKEDRKPKVHHLALNKLDAPPPVVIPVRVGGHLVEFELDTGSPVNAISNALYSQYFKSVHLETGGKEQFVCYNGSCFQATGKFEVEMKFEGHKSREEIFVFEGDRQPLLGRQTMQRWGLRINFCHLTESMKEFKAPLNVLLTKYQEVFEGELGCYRYGKVHLPLKDGAVPKFFKPRRVPLAFKEKVEDELDRLENIGIISKVPSTEAEWGTPLVPVLKKDSSIRLCADYRLTVNPWLKDDHHPFPIIDDIFAALQGGKHFSKLDLKNAYNQLEVDEEARHLLAWSTHRGVYYVNRLPFGTKTACAVFQATLERVLQGCRGTIIYLDDVLVTGRTVKEHLENLEQVLSKLKETGFVLNKTKCEFFKSGVSYLGHYIDSDGLHKDPEKVESIIQLGVPKDVKEVRAFVGLVNYYAKFCPSLAQHLKPLYRLLQEEVKFRWSKECQEAFKAAKQLLADDTVLAHYDRNLPIKLYSDASKEGIGAVIVHVFPDGKERPVSFASRVFKKHESNYSVIDREALAIYYGVQRFSSYLSGRRFILMTDHKPLTGLFSEKGIPETAAGRLQRWAVYLSNFDFEIQHIKGTSNVVADFLSRFPCTGNQDEKVDEEEAISFLNFIEVETRSLVERKQIIIESRRDKVISRVVEYLKSGWPQNLEDGEIKKLFQRRDELSVEEGVLLWGFRIVIPAKLRKPLLSELHVVHMGIVKMKSLARSYFWWPSLDKEIEDIGKKCEFCLQLQPERSDPISPWRLTSAPGDRVHVDHFSFQGADFLVLVDSYSKWLEVYPVRTLTSKETSEKLAEYISRFGLISTLVSDNGTAFTSEEFQAFCSSRGIKHLTTAPYSPCSNGAAENAVKTVKAALKKLASDPSFAKKPISVQLHSFLEMYRATTHTSTGESPFKRMFGREMRIRFDNLKSRSTIRQKETVEYQNRTKKDVSFNINETVYVRDYRQPNKKSWIRGRIVARLGSVLYECHTQEMGTVKRRSHQIMKYPYDDFDGNEADGATPGPEPNDDSIYEDPMESLPGEEPSSEALPVPSSVGRHQPDGTYVTRYNRVVKPPRN